ncbi:hypothetical protein N431DRAFT_429340 [Stipitochalara longipes BDJ]|nr:hypothetical protein N431DRAFT_429340 [Stipitochalara longipes BDJ]
MFSAISHVETPSFPQFNELPKELRVMIWHAAIPDPRVVYLRHEFLPFYTTTRVWSDKAVDETFQGDDEHCDGDPTFFDATGETDEGDYGPEDQCKKLASPCALPNLLFVCHESYQVAIKYYEKAFGSHHSFPETWFDFERDALYLDWGSKGPELSLDDFLSSEASRVRHLVMHGYPNTLQYHNQALDHEDLLCDVLNVFTHLECLTTVLFQEHSPGEGGSIALVKPQADLPALCFETADPESGKRTCAPSIRELYDILSRAAPLFDTQKPERYRAEDRDRGIATWTKLPIFDYQMATTPERKGYCEQLESQSENLARTGLRHGVLGTGAEKLFWSWDTASGGNA